MVTIVVLLILAGISINLLWGEHGILNTAKNAGVQAKIAEIEDKANVIYKGIETEKLVGTKENITMDEIVAKLQANGYQIEKETGAGNVWEWTMEAYNNNCRVGRGGNYCNTGSASTACTRSNFTPDGAYDNVGARIALYL